MFWKQYLPTLCGYQSYGSCWNSLASEWGWRGEADVDGKQICSSHLSFRCVHPSGSPGPSSLGLPTGCVCLMLRRASSKTSYAHDPSAIFIWDYLRTSQIHTQTRMYGWKRYLVETPQEFRHLCDLIEPVTSAAVCKLQRKRTVSALWGKATVVYSSNHLKWTSKSHYDCGVQESMQARSRIRKSNGGCFSVRLNSSEGLCAD